MTEAIQIPPEHRNLSSSRRRTLLERVRALAPWHMNVALAPDVRTIDGNRGSRDEPGISAINPVELRPLLEQLYPNGLAGKRFIDCACNGGGYSLLASDLGAYAFGFDVRQHWIAQAQFLKQHFGRSDEQVRFEVCDLLDVHERLGSERFDICLFKGIFYHLPDPVAGLKIVADRTDEVLIVDTAVAKDCEDGFLKLVSEGVEQPMSGVHHLAWHPTGPKVLSEILGWLGFKATCVVYWRRRHDRPRDRIRIVGARDASLLAGLAVPPTTEVLIPRAGETVAGTTTLAASAQGNVVEVSRVEFHLSGARSDDALIAIATPTIHGWIAQWDTTSVGNGSCVLNSMAFDAAGTASHRSENVPITVQN
jgi:tRNA (mo5U34)-methyltransferase